LSPLMQTISQIGQAGGKAILDLHNYGRYCLRYRGTARSVVIGQKIDGRFPVTEDHLADLWQRLAQAFRKNSAVVGYGLMNEPHDMGDSDWKAISQHIVQAIRDVDRETHLLIAGDGWSNAHRWRQIHSPEAWIRDPANRFAYEAHCYFDADSSGKYELTFAEELDRDPKLFDRGAVRVAHFLNWCRENRVAGFLGEFGIPRSDSRWQTVMGRFLESVAEVHFPVCYWAAGAWWGDYPLSIQPSASFRDHAPQLNLLQQFCKKA
ncbi:MAG: cellulase family glycosylhydrolase, partial [Planctomycetaceae bacterium]|nr:cellulase family glycosylhydrolase [Planctomycetaceae bacterium]